MSDRRAFLRAAGGAVFALGRSARSAPTAKRPRNGSRSAAGACRSSTCTRIACFPDVSRRVPGINAPRVAPPTLVLGPERLAAMDERGIDIQALSVNAYWWYSANRDDARAVVATHDEGIAAWCKEHPTRFVGLSSVALQFPDLAAEQLEHAVKNLGLARRLDRRPRRQRAADEREVRSVLGEGRGARRARCSCIRTTR